MNKKDKIDQQTAAIRKNTATKSANREAEVLSVIERMCMEKEPVNFSSVAKRSGASRSYLHSNERIKAEIQKLSASSKSKTPRSETSKDVIIRSLKRENDKLKTRIRNLESENKDSYKQQNARLKLEIAELKRQLAEAYSKAWK